MTEAKAVPEGTLFAPVASEKIDGFTWLMFETEKDVAEEFRRMPEFLIFKGVVFKKTAYSATKGSIHYRSVDSANLATGFF